MVPRHGRLQRLGTRSPSQESNFFDFCEGVLILEIIMKTGIYKHSKTGNLYRVHFVAKHSETLDDLVVYEALYKNDKSKYWVRPLAMFEEIVTVEEKKVPRFQFISEK